MTTLEQEAILRHLQKYHIRELENIMADIATLTIKPTTITWNCGLGSMIITTGKAQEILNEHSQTLEQAADKMESKHTEVWVEGRTIFEQEGEPTEGIKGNLEEIPSNVDLEEAAEEYAFGNLDDAALYGCTMSGRIAAFKAGAKWQKKQKPEWSDEDKFKLEDAITGIDVGIGFYETEGKHPNLLKAIIEAKEWLKSLEPQPKQEWIKEQTKNQ